MSEETKTKISAEMEKFISYIEKMTVLELSELIKALEDRLGVSAAAPVAAVADLCRLRLLLKRQAKKKQSLM